MKINVDKKFLLKIATYSVFIMLAPFAFELIIMADIIGVEAAIAFLFVYGKSVAILFRDRVVLAYNIMMEVCRSAPHTNFYAHKVYAVSAFSSVVFIWFTGSLFLASVAWVPSLAYVINIA